MVFIHERTRPTNTSTVVKINVAKDIWMSRDITSHWFENDFINCLKTRRSTDFHILDIASRELQRRNCGLRSVQHH
ncbi:hypothetical protein Sjap_008910 [Stephania japonica]|uniref:Uncharacterized protein n=1 Tax=Stephania japonica TaxID=461633 RepID=A0AAP0JR72_9MAGN